jgi:hypothetical protein
MPLPVSRRGACLAARRDWFNLVESWHSFPTMGRMNLEVFDEKVGLAYGLVRSLLVLNMVQIDGLGEVE